MTAPSSLSPSTFMKMAHERARNHQWFEAAVECQRELSQIEPTKRTADFYVQTVFLANCLFRAAFQAKTRTEFEERIRSSKETFDNAREFYEIGNEIALSKMAQMGAEIAEFWSQRNTNQRRIAARPIVGLAEESAKVFEESGRKEESFKVKVGLLGFLRDSINLFTDYADIRDMFDKAIQIGASFLEDSGQQSFRDVLVQGLSSTVWFLAFEGEAVLAPLEFQSSEPKIRRIQAALEKISIKTNRADELFLIEESAGHIAFDVDGNPSEAAKRYGRSLEIANSLSDSLIKGRLQWISSQALFWSGYGESDPEKKRSLFMDGQVLAEKAIQSLEIPFDTTYIAISHSACAQCLIELARLAGVEETRKRNLLAKAVDVASVGLRYESDTWAWSQVAHNLAKALYFQSKLAEPRQRLDLLRESLAVRKKLVEVNNHLFPDFWNNVIAPYHLALVKSEIATFENDLQTKKDLLRESISDMELCLKRGEKWGTNSGFLFRLGEHNEAYGEILSKLYALTDDRSVALDSIKAYEKAIDDFQATKSIASVAAIRWKIATIHNDLHQLQQAAHEFRGAAADYRRAVDIRGSVSLFEEIGKYLEAWSLIESARIAHDEGQYVMASEIYSKASIILGNSREWSHLALLFEGRSLLERGEGLSTEENHDQAKGSFKMASQKLREEIVLLEKKIPETEGAKERQELEGWLAIARQRESHCNARLALEEARALEIKGDKTASSRKFRESSEILTRLAGKVTDPQERTETEGLAKFCEGWALMKEAEAEASPDKYSEAAESFLKLRTQTKGQFLHLALANAAICRALSAGTLFQQTRDVRYYSELKRHTETAAESFRQAGFRKTEAWTRATQRLFDSLIFITDAESERDPKRKTELYRLAESHLELAAKLYDEAGFSTRKEEALSHLERVREEKSVLLEPLEALSQIPTATASALPLSPRGRGQPAGLQRFEEAYVVGDLNIPHREVPLGSMFSLDFELANVGRAPASLVKLQNVLPEGFEPASDPEISREGKLDLLGRTLERLKTHVIKLQAKASRTGEIELRPRLFYTDDSGSYKTYQFQPTTLTVVDTGPPSEPLPLAPRAAPATVELPTDLRFDLERSRMVFQSLVRDFLVDYMTKRIYVEKAGWRTLVQIIQETKIPRSSLYGPRGRDGPVLAELERRGLIESRIFPKERGRGGSVKRIRVAYDNLIVKKIAEEAAFSNE